MSVRVNAVGFIQVGVALALCAAMSGCKKQSESTSPSADKASEAQAPHDSADPVAELAALEGRMRALGLPAAADKQKGATTSTTEGEDEELGEVANGGARGDGQSAPAEEAPATSPATTAQIDAPARDEQNYCSDLCSLSESICTLEVRICSLAESHSNDAIYADACERAIEDCEVAGQACDGCG